MAIVLMSKLCWDYHKLKPLLFDEPPSFDISTIAIAPPHPVEHLGYGVVVLSGLAVTLAARSFLPQRILLYGLLMGLVGGLILVTGWFLTARRFWRTARAAA